MEKAEATSLLLPCYKCRSPLTDFPYSDRDAAWSTYYYMLCWSYLTQTSSVKAAVGVQVGSQPEHPTLSPVPIISASRKQFRLGNCCGVVQVGSQPEHGEGIQHYLLCLYIFLSVVNISFEKAIQFRDLAWRRKLPLATWVPCSCFSKKEKYTGSSSHGNPLVAVLERESCLWFLFTRKKDGI